MNKTNIHYLHVIKQDTKEGIYTMKGISLTNLIHSLIREYGYYSDGTYSIDPNTFLLSDKKLVLSHILDSEEYEWTLQNTTRIEIVFNENIKHIEQLFNSECDEVYRENMEESNLTRHTHQDNHESYWTRR